MENLYKKNILAIREMSDEDAKNFIIRKLECLEKKASAIEYKNSNPKLKAISDAELNKIKVIVQNSLDEFIKECKTPIE